MGFNKRPIWIFLTQVKEKHHFSSAADENTKRSQTLILKVSIGCRDERAYHCVCGPSVSRSAGGAALTFRTPTKKKKEVGLHQQRGRQANMQDATLISRLLKNSIF